MRTQVRIAAPDELPLCHRVRHEVFVVGQQVPLHEDLDGLDPLCLHLLAFVDGDAVGTARLRDVHGHAKIERVAVRDAWRGQGFGKRLMERLHAEALRLGYDEAALNAQIQVVSFYEALGYEAHGEPFVDAGIWHRAMRRGLGA